MKIKVVMTTLVMLTICLLVGCTSSKFDSSYKQFKESYVLATDFLETSNDSLKGLKNMDENLVKTEFEKMKDSMDKMSTELNSKDEKGIYSNVEGYYQGVASFLYAKKNYDTLSIEEKMEFYIEADLASMNRKSIEKGEE